MLINPFTGVVNSALSSAKSNSSRLQGVVAQLASGDRIQRAADDVSALSIATNLQNEVSSLRTALSNTGQLSSLLQVAGNDISQIQNALQELNNIATQANSGALSDANRAALDVQFQSVLESISDRARQSSFGGTSLLDGSLSGANALDLNAILGDGSDSVALSIEALDALSLFGGALNVRTQDDAEQAILAIQQAFNNVGTTQASIGAFAEQLDFASGYIETAIANQDAARSVLNDTDFTTAATLLSQASLKEQAGILTTVQAKRLPPSMLELLIS
jgi:flagellin